jgi:periplasmic protein TonB
MIKLSAIQTGFAVSLLVHGTIFSVVAYAHRPGHAALPGALEPSSLVEIVMDAEQPAAAVPAAPPVVVTPKPELAAAEPVTVQPVLPPPPVELPKPLPEEAPKAVAVVTDQTIPPAVEPPVTMDGQPAASVFLVGPALATGESSADHPGYLANPKPVYPPEARRRRQQGLVVLEVFISEAGRPQRVAVAQSSGHVLLDTAAVEAVKRWQFTPARLGKLPIAAQVEIPIRFQLSGSADAQPVLGKL